MTYKTPEGKASRKVAEALDGLSFSPAMFASCFSTLGGEPIQERFAEVIAAQIDQWRGEGRQPNDGTAVGKLLAATEGAEFI